MQHLVPKFAAAIVAFALVAMGPAKAETIPAGWDYFTTLSSGTFVEFGGATIPLMGAPIGPGNTDTIVQRLSDITINGAAGAIQVSALSLQSIGPVPGLGAPISIKLDPAYLDKDVGELTISGSSATGGTFTSFFDVFFDICIPNSGCVFGGQKHFEASGTWLPTPPPGSVNPNGDFFPNVTLHTAPGAQHEVATASIPETTTWTMMLIGFGSMGYLACRRRKSPAFRVAN